MHMRERDVWRYAGDQRLMSGLMADEAIAQRLASPIYRHARNANRVRLLASAVMVEPDVLPNLAVALDRLHAECPDVTRLECYVFSHPEINAFVCEGRQRTIVGLSSAAVNHLDADELMFVLGHEFGHAAFGHLELCAGHLAEDPGVMPAATMRVRAWQRAAEISADRAGLVLAGSLSAAARALFKVASGIVSAAIPASPERFAAQWQRLVDEVIEEGEREFHHCSHPFPPLRMRALCEFWAASGSADAPQAIDAANRSIDRMLATMDPAAASGPLGDPLFADHFFWGGLYLAVGAGEPSPAERERLASVVPAGEEIDQAIGRARANPEWCRERFLEGVRARRRKFSALEIHRIIFGLLDMASADGAVHEREKTRLLELARLIGVPEAACELVITQYEKERRHED